MPLVYRGAVIKVYKDSWERIHTHKIEGKRYPLERGRLFKVKGQRGVYRVHEMYAYKTNPDRIEIHAWWRDKELFTGGRAMWRYATPKNITKVLGKIEKV